MSKTAEQKTQTYIPHSFRISEDMLGYIQHLLIDKERPVSEIAARFKLSKSTVYNIRKAVPAQFTSRNEHANTMWRQAHTTAPRRRLKIA